MRVHHHLVRISFNFQLCYTVVVPSYVGDQGVIQDVGEHLAAPVPARVPL
jgi:hypothetical protein